MSIFYCEYHGKLEDADYVNCHEDPSGDGMVCDEGLAEIEAEAEEAKMPNNHTFTPEQMKVIKEAENADSEE